MLHFESAMNKILFKSFNPYEDRFPNRKVLSRADINLMKYFRSKDYEVIVEPEDEFPVHMLTQKNFIEYLPTVLELAGNLSIGVISGLIANYLSKDFAKSNSDEFIIKQGERIYSKSGESLSEKEANQKLNSAMNVRKQFGEAFERESPYEDSPYPLFWEHSGVIIGWCSVDVDEQGLFIKSGRLTSVEATEAIGNGSLQGFSIGGLVKKPICSVCHSNYIDCQHFAGRSYHGDMCVNQLTEIDLAEISLVKSPANALTGIDFKKM